MAPTDSRQAPADDKQAPAEAQAPELKAHEPAPRPARAKSGGAIFLALVAIVLAAGLAALSWYDTRARIDATQTELARRLRDIETQSRDARTLAQQAQESVRELQTRLGQMDSRIAGLQSQKLALDSMYRDLTRNRDDLQLAEIQQVLSIASQQLQLSGNVHAALLALQFADKQLARADNPRFMPVRRAIAHDVEELDRAGRAGPQRVCQPVAAVMAPATSRGPLIEAVTRCSPLAPGRWMFSGATILVRASRR